MKEGAICYNTRGLCDEDRCYCDEPKAETDSNIQLDYRFDNTSFSDLLNDYNDARDEGREPEEEYDKLIHFISGLLRAAIKPTPNNIAGEWNKRIDDIAKSYKDLEKTGHIELGAVSDNLNWQEIKKLIQEAIAAERERIVQLLAGGSNYGVVPHPDISLSEVGLRSILETPSPDTSTKK